MSPQTPTNTQVMVVITVNATDDMLPNTFILILHGKKLLQSNHFHKFTAFIYTSSDWFSQAVSHKIKTLQIFTTYLCVYYHVQCLVHCDILSVNDIGITLVHRQDQIMCHTYI